VITGEAHRGQFDFTSTASHGICAMPCPRLVHRLQGNAELWLTGFDTPCLT